MSQNGENIVSELSKWRKYSLGSIGGEKYRFRCAKKEKIPFRRCQNGENNVYELSKGLRKLGHEVTICSSIGGEMEKKAKSLGIKLCQANEPPGFKLGDCKTSVQTPQGPVLMKEGQLYKISDVKFDVMHLLMFDHIHYIYTYLSCF